MSDLAAQDSPDASGALVHAAVAAGEAMHRRSNFVEEISRGEWTDLLTPAASRDLADVLDATTESIRHAREVAGHLSAGSLPHPYAVDSLAGVVGKGLPLNRKERYYTSTVLPMVIASDGFAHLHRFLALCGLRVDPLKDDPLEGLVPIEFFSEYNFAESRFTAEDRARFVDPPMEGDTPDLVIVGPDWLVAVEAKMFHAPLASTLNVQLRRQRVLIDYWTASLDLAAHRVAHVALVPSGLSVNGLVAPTVTWESVLNEYQTVAPAYWTAVLRVALDRYDQLRSRGRFGENAHGRMTGLEIVQQSSAGTFDFTHMGRDRGLDGDPLREDVATGTWRNRLYEVRTGPLPGNPNWFSITEFIARTMT